MYSLRLTCKPEVLDWLSGELWEAGTAGIQEIAEEENVILIAGFETGEQRPEILKRFSAYTPIWCVENATDWAAVSQDAWPGREIGERLFLAPRWATQSTPRGRLRLIHNPGLASGTGEHPCTQLALMVLEKFVTAGCTAVDVGTGSGILAIAALRLGAARAIGIDIDRDAISAAVENFRLNALTAELICGGANAIATTCADLTVANISGTVLLNEWDELLRITRQAGTLILTGFPETESRTFRELLPSAEIFELDGWQCLAAKLV